MLLLGYAAEMYLKAGLLKAYANCDDETFLRDARFQFGHSLRKLCEQVSLPLSSDEKDRLERLEKLMGDARYPMRAKDQATWVAAKNQQTALIWNQSEFRNCTGLVERIKYYVSMLDEDSDHPASIKRVQLGTNGYLAFRTGGRLPTRITFRCSNMSLAILSDFVTSEKSLFDVKFRWDEAFIFEDNGRGTKLLRRPIQSGPVADDTASASPAA